MGKTIWGSGTHRFWHFWAQSILFTAIPQYHHIYTYTYIIYIHIIYIYSEGITWYYTYYICQNIDSWNISEAWTTTKPTIPIAAVVLAGWRMWRIKQLSSCPVHQTFFHVIRSGDPIPFIVNSWNLFGNPSFNFPSSLLERLRWPPSFRCFHVFSRLGPCQNTFRCKAF